MQNKFLYSILKTFFISFLISQGSFSFQDSLFNIYIQYYFQTKNYNNSLQFNNFLIQETGNPFEEVNYSRSLLNKRYFEFNFSNRSITDPANSKSYEALIPKSFFVNLEVIEPTKIILPIEIEKSSNKFLPISVLNFSQLPFDWSEFEVLFNSSLTDNSSIFFELNKNNFGNKSSDDFYKGRFQNSFNDYWTSRIFYDFKINNRFRFSLQNIYGEAENGINSGIQFTTPQDSMYDDLIATSRSLTTFSNTKIHHVDLNLNLPLSEDSTFEMIFNIYNSNFSEELSTYNNLYDTTFTPIDLRNKHNTNVSGFYWGSKLFFNYGNVEFFLKNEKHELEEFSFSNSPSYKKYSFGTKSLLLWANFTMSTNLEIEKYRSQKGVSSFSSINWNYSKNVEPYFIISSNTKFPNFKEIYWNDVLTLVPVERNFSVTTINFIEIGSLFKTENGQLNLSINSLKIKNNIEPNFINTLTQSEFYSKAFQHTTFIQDSTEQRFNSVNAKLNSNFSKFNLKLNISYNLKFNSNYAPKYYGNLNLSFSDMYFKNNLFATVGIDAIFKSKYFAPMLIYPSRVFISQNFMEVKDELTLNAYIRALVQKVILEVRADNLLNSKYMTIPLYPMMPRYYSFRLSWAFEN